MERRTNADETYWSFCVWVRLLCGLRCHVAICGRIHWEPGFAANAGWCGIHAGWPGRRDRCGFAAVVRSSTQHHGTSMVQGAVDANCSTTYRAFDLRSVFEPGLAAAVFTLGTDRRCKLVRRKSGRPGSPAFAVRTGIAARSRRDFPDQSF